jgi:hypothetical protein
MFSVHVAAQSSEREAEVVDCPVRFFCSMTPDAQDLNVLHTEQAGSRPGFGVIATLSSRRFSNDNATTLRIAIMGCKRSDDVN